MNERPKIYRVGDVTVTRVTEMVNGGVLPEIYFPGSWNPGFLESNRDSLPAGLLDGNSQLIVKPVTTRTCPSTQTLPICIVLPEKNRLQAFQAISSLLDEDYSPAH
ncbi:hypothetical protein ACP26L_18125 [Paenibacillus sp. S-38]|uniref:hypothetical protein n=1 Tax=Paenibacillus sp. S-38 TaxID=3416710 RepID=UPI003CF3B14B